MVDLDLPAPGGDHGIWAGKLNAALDVLAQAVDDAGSNIDGVVASAETWTDQPDAPVVRRRLSFPLTTGSPDLWLVEDGSGRRIMSLNEWGGLRGFGRAYPWFDSLVRAIREDGDDAAGFGCYTELEDRRAGRTSDRMFGVQWADGRIIQGDELVGAVYTLNVWETLDDVPATLPPGTTIVQRGD